VKKPNTIEHDIDEIRVKIYNDTKGLTVEQINDYFHKRAAVTMTKYHFKRAANAQSVARPQAVL
jgi:hypothetical protein